MIKGLKRIGQKIATGVAIGLTYLSLTGNSDANAQPFLHPLPLAIPIQNMAAFPYRPIQNIGIFPSFTPFREIARPLSYHPPIIYSTYPYINLDSYLAFPQSPSWRYIVSRRGLVLPGYARWPAPYLQPLPLEKPRIFERPQPQEQLPNYQEQPQQLEEKSLEEKVEPPLNEEESDRVLEETLTRLNLSYALNVVYEYKGEEIEADAVVLLPGEMVGIFYLQKDDLSKIGQMRDMCKEKNMRCGIFYGHGEGDFKKSIGDLFQKDNKPKS